MRILQIFNRYLEKGGEEASVNRIFQSLEERHEIRQLSFASESWLGEPWYLKALQVPRMFRNPAALRLLRREVETFRPDAALLHNVFPVGSLACYTELVELGVPVVQYIHNFRPFSVNGYCWAEGRIADRGLNGDFWPEIRSGAWQHSRLKTACYAAVLWTGHRRGIWQGIDGWVAISDFMRETFIAGGIDPERVTTVRHCWDRLNPDETPPPSDGRKSLLFLGRMTEEKGLRVLADAWERVERERADGELVVGGQGPMEEWFRERVKGLKRVRVEGFVQGERKRELLAGCRAMVVPSVWWEPLGLVVYEAYDFCRPVLAAAGGGLTETVVAGETGWLHPPGEAVELAKQMHEVLDGDGGEAARRGRAGRRWLEANTAVGPWIDKLEGVFARVVKGPQPAGIPES